MSQLGEKIAPPSTVKAPEAVKHLVTEKPKRMINFSS
jgi:hypothetical protein